MRKLKLLPMMLFIIFTLFINELERQKMNLSRTTEPPTKKPSAKPKLFLGMRQKERKKLIILMMLIGVIKFHGRCGYRKSQESEIVASENINDAKEEDNAPEKLNDSDWTS